MFFVFPKKDLPVLANGQAENISSFETLSKVVAQPSARRGASLQLSLRLLCSGFWSFIVKAPPFRGVQSFTEGLLLRFTRRNICCVIMAFVKTAVPPGMGGLT